MSWPELLKARNSARAICAELDRLLKESNGLNKKELAMYKEVLLAGIDESAGLISREIEELEESLENHRKYVESKARFLKRHYKRL